MKDSNHNLIRRPPVVAVMGHIDHGKSTLLDYIRKTNIVDSEFGGITQHISAYEVAHKREDGQIEKITFLDTPGHAAFQAMRARGAAVADIAILVVSAEDGVKPQTLEAHKTIVDSNIPFIVAINKIDKPNANIEKTKSSLAENNIFIEGYGGNIPSVAISAKMGQNIGELLDMIILVADLEDLKGDINAPVEGIIIESSMDEKRGILATLVIKNGTIRSDQCAVAGSAFSPVRMMEDFTGKKISEATFSSPVRIIGWSSIPEVGSAVLTCSTKKEAEVVASKYVKTEHVATVESTPSQEGDLVIPLIIKTDVAGVADAVIHEIQKIEIDRIKFKILKSEAGIVSENDVKTATTFPGSIILGFNVKTDARALELADRSNVDIKTFNVIYKLTEWLEEIANSRRPLRKENVITGQLKVLKFFSENKHKQVIGCSVIEGTAKVGDEVIIVRRDEEIGKGKISELQQNRSKVKEISDGECGLLLDAIITVAPGDILKAVSEIEK